LKLATEATEAVLCHIAPITGARIETSGDRTHGAPGTIAPITGARIETFSRGGRLLADHISPPSRGRGLKLRRLPPMLAAPPDRPHHGGAD